MYSTLLNMYINYFKMLEEKGITKRQLVYKLIVLDYINDMLQDPNIILYLDNEQIEHINKYLTCYVNNCLND